MSTHKVFRSVAGVVTLSFLVGAVLAAGPVAHAEEVPADWAPKAQEWDPIPHERVSGRGPKVESVPALGARGTQAEPPLETGVFEVDPGLDPLEWVEVADTAVEVRGATPLSVEVIDPETLTGDTGSLGAVVAIETLDDVATDQMDPVEVRLDLTAVTSAGDPTRVQLVELPACAVTTPEVEGCLEAAPLPETVVDESTGLVSVELSGPSMVMALAAAPSGGGGSFAAQPLASSSLWSGGGSTGEFTWTYPIEVGPAVGEIAPTIALSYSSSTVDGRVASSNNQPGWIGQGWSYEPGYIERTYVTCADDPSGKAPKKQDLCWWDNTLHMNLGGTSAVLVRDAATGVWHPKNDDGTRIERLTGAPNNAYQGEYWKVTTPDGMAFYFGREALPGRTTQPLTGATWTVPVYGAKAGDPCYSTAGFASSRCDQAWRWNLDYVEDTRGNAAAYYYTPETNYYQANAATRVSYVRGGVLNRIEYGLRNTGASVYAAAATSKVLFTTAERCIPTSDFDCAEAKFTSANASRWPDTPQDLSCTSAGTCAVFSPTFWSRKRLTQILSQGIDSSGVWRNLHKYDLTQTYPDQGDKALWLDQVRHTGYSATGIAMAQDPVRFSGQLMDNRVDGYLGVHPMLMWRLTQIQDENGAVTSVTYTPRDCSAGSVPNTADLANNTRRCFPVKWTLPYETTPKIDFFHKYLVARVQVSDPAAMSPSHVTQYRYLGTPAWRFDDNELTKPTDRTWGQFRGYREVHTLTGDAGTNTNGALDKLTLEKTFYLRGMHGDRLANGSTRTATVTNSLGETITDLDEFTGRVYESQSLNGETGPVLSKELTGYQVLKTTGSRPRTGLSPVTSAIVVTTGTRSITIPTSGTATTATTTLTYDDQGRLTSETASATGIAATCTTYTYAANTAKNIIGLPAQITTHTGACSATGTASGTILDAERHYYDGSTTLGSLTGPGNPTRSEKAVTTVGGVIEWARTETQFDTLGRATRATEYTSTTDTTGRATTTTYTPAATGPMNTVVVADALGNTTTSSYDVHGRLTKLASSTGEVTEATYDPLGRITAVWEPGMPRTGPATTTHTYTVSASGPETMTTTTTVSTGTGTGTATVTRIELYDAMGQLRQTQTDAVGGGRTVTDTFYDSHGWPIRTNNHWYTTGAPTATLITAADAAIDSRTVYSYDSAGRQIGTTFYKGTTITRRQHTIHGGNQITTIPPTGGTITSAIFDAYGRTTQLRQYTTAPSYNVTAGTITGGTYTATTYAYDDTSQLVSMTDSVGATWLFSYDMAGRQTALVDPDAGTSTSTYNHTGDLLRSVDARGTAGTLNYTYDQIGRITAIHGGVGNKPIGTWTYDTLKKGLLTESRSFVGGDTTNPWIEKVTGYDTYGRPLGAAMTVPTTQGALAGTYTTTNTYTATGEVRTSTTSAAGGLPAETITYGYNAQGLPTSMVGANQYVNSVTYNPYGLASQIIGRENNSLIHSYTYNPETFALDQTALHGHTTRPMISQNTHTRDITGKITRTVAEMNFNNPAAVRTTCYSYDTYERLTDAWTATDNCATKPTATAKDQVGGMFAMFTSWSFNSVGARTQQIKHKIPAYTIPTHTTTYSIGVPGHHHATGTVTANNGTTTTTTTNTYDAAGNTTRRVTGATTETLTWNAQGRAETITKGTQKTTYTYNADGDIIARTDPTGTTIYTPTGEIHLRNGQVSADRYYDFNNTTIAHRSSTGTAKLYALYNDPVGTATLTIDWNNLATVIWRFLDPYGNRQTGIGTWPTDHTYLNLPTEATSGLVQTGSRLYDPIQGRFLSVDPVLGPDTPQSLNSYSYTFGDPVNTADPSGNWPNWSKAWKGAKNFAGGAAKYFVGSTLDLAQGIGTVATFAVTRNWKKSVAANKAWSDRARKTYSKLEDRLGIDRNSRAYKTGYKAAMVAELATGAAGLAKAGARLAVKAATKHVATKASKSTAQTATKQGAKATARAKPSRGGAGTDNAAPKKTQARECSFSGETVVLMADGSRKPIQDIRVGDLVVATDPETGEQAAKPVEHVFVHEDTVIDLKVDGETITTTEDHPFWSVTEQKFQRADQLEPGETVLTATGQTLTTTGLNPDSTRWTVAYNLAVQDIHTYHVGQSQTLVHNMCPIGGKEGPALPEALTAGRNAEEGVHVYVGVRQESNVYVGITNNVARRQAEHGDRFVLQQMTGDGGLTRGQARAVEQAMIERSPGFENMRNSISPAHSYYRDAVDWGEEWLTRNGFLR